MEGDVQPCAVVAPQEVIAIVAETAATAAAAAGATPAHIGSIVRSAVLSQRCWCIAGRLAAASESRSGAGASQEASSGVQMQQSVPQDVPYISSRPQCMD